MSLLSFIFPDFGGAADRRVTSYEDVHADVQSILLPPTHPKAKGINLYFLQSLNKSFALQHSIALEPGPLQQGMFGPMPGPGKRYYYVGGILTHVTEGGGKHRVAAQYDVQNGSGRSTLLSDVWGDGRLRVQGQVVDDKSDPATAWGATVTLRGEDYVTVARAAHGPEVGLSYNQRIGPGSPLTVGGELFFSRPSYLKAARPEEAAGVLGGEGRKPLEWAVGAAYDAGDHKTAVHLATTGPFTNVLSLHHLFRASDRTHIAAKFMCTPFMGTSMLSAGYRMRFRNTLTTIHGVVDTYGSVRAVLEREPLKDVKVGLIMESKLAPWANRSETEGAASFGFRVGIGTPAPIVAPLSPCTMSRDIFSVSA